jgi:hypothetical protein
MMRSQYTRPRWFLSPIVLIMIVVSTTEVPIAEAVTADCPYGQKLYISFTTEPAEVTVTATKEQFLTNTRKTLYNTKSYGNETATVEFSAGGASWRFISYDMGSTRQAVTDVSHKCG